MIHDIQLESARSPPEVHAHPSEQHHEPGHGRPDNQDSGKTTIKIQKTKPPLSRIGINDGAENRL